MRNIPIIGKFLVILCAFGLFVAGVTAYSSSRTSFIDASYTSLLDEDFDGDADAGAREPQSRFHAIRHRRYPARAH